MFLELVGYFLEFDEVGFVAVGRGRLAQCHGTE